MKKTLLFLLAAAVLMMFVPLTAVAASDGSTGADSQNVAVSVVEDAQSSSVDGNVQNVSEPDVSLGLPKVTEQDALDKATRITGKIHGLASQVIPEITLVILVVGAVLGIFWGEARRMVLFAIIALVVVLWAPFLVSLAVSLLNS